MFKERAIATRPTHTLINYINTISLCSTRSRSLYLDCTHNKLCRHENSAHLAKRGFSTLNAYGPEFKPECCTARLDDFKQFYGSTSVVLTDVWHDMMTTNISLQLTISDKSDKGLTSSWWPIIFFGHTQKICSCLPLLSNSSASKTQEERSYSSTTTTWNRRVRIKKA
jgi:hypothetical protein